MIIREPFVHVTYYYLREAPGDNPDRREHYHTAFVADAGRVLRALAGWLAIPVPELPEIPVWDDDPPYQVQALADSSVLEGRTNAGAMLGTYVLRNMLLLRVIVGRHGEHDQAVWPMLDEALRVRPATPSWLHTVRYWCGVAPRPPEEFEQERLQPVRTDFGVLSLGDGNLSHMLVYPDARTENRANVFLKTLAAELDWFPVQARYRQSVYDDHASRVARTQQMALESVLRTDAIWHSPDEGPGPADSLYPLQIELDALQSVHSEVLGDLSTTRAAAHEMRALTDEYRRALMQHSLWDAAPTVWEAQVATLAHTQARIEADVLYIDHTLRRVETTLHTLQTRVTLVQAERERLLLYVTGSVGLALVAVLVVDTNLWVFFWRVFVLALLSGGLWYALRQGWLRLL